MSRSVIGSTRRRALITACLVLGLVPAAASAYDPNSTQAELKVWADHVPDGPGTATIIVTLEPPPDPYTCYAKLKLNGNEQPGYQASNLDSPVRARWIFSPHVENGTYTFYASYSECGYLYVPNPVPVTITVGTADSQPPTGSIEINEGDPYTNSNAVYVRPDAHDNETDVAYVALSLDQQDWVVYPMDDAVWYGLPLTPGTYTLYGKYADTFGNWSTVSSDSIVFDDSPPVVAPPSQQFVVGSSISNGRVVVRVPLSASDALSGVAGVNLAERKDNGSWANVQVSGSSVTALGADSVDRTLAPGHAYTFRARADDNATNSGDWVVGPRLNLKAYQDGNVAISYSGKWVKKSVSSFWGGAARASSKPGAKATLTFTGRSFGWVTTYGPDRGKAEVWVNGVLQGTIDLYSPTVLTKRVAWAGTWATAAPRTVTIKVLGTANRPRVDIDGLISAQ